MQIGFILVNKVAIVTSLLGFLGLTAIGNGLGFE